VRHRHAALALAKRDYGSGLRHQSLTLAQHKWPQRGTRASGARQKSGTDGQSLYRLHSSH
jgi:hypothetical protein